MRRAIQTLALLSFPSLLPMFAACDEVRVLTYNIHHGEGIDGRFDLERIARVIRSSHAHVVALQEVDQRTRRTNKTDTLANLAQLTGMRTLFGKSMDYDGGEYGNAILVQGRILSHKVHPIPTSPGREPRSILNANIQLPGCPHTIQFLATHLDHMSQAGRIAGVRLASSLTSDLPAILAGDLNAPPSNEAIRYLSNTWSIAGSGGPIPTFPVKEPKVQIDYIFMLPAAAWKVKEVTALPEILASDHRPLLAVLRLY